LFLLKACAVWNVFGKCSDNRPAFFTIRRRDDHSLRFQTTQLARLEVRDDHDFATDQFLRLVILRDAGEYLPRLLFTDIDFHQQKLVGFRDTLGGKNLACWCPLDAPCHADVLLQIANSPSKTPRSKPRKTG